MQLICHYYYGALGAALGRTNVVACEVGENGNSINAHYAFTRGSARQFQTAWMVDFSAWMQGYITDFSTSRPWGKSSSAGGQGGHSLSLFKRAYYTAFMQGASQLVAEAGAVNWFFQNFSEDGVLTLSPLGRIGRNFSAYSRRVMGTGIGSVPGRGVHYSPIAIVMEPAHGFGENWFYSALSWGFFPLTPQENLLWSLFKSIWPGAWTPMNDFTDPQKSELGYMTASPFGDIFDVLQQIRSLTATDIPPGVLSLYRILWFAGDVILDSQRVDAIVSFCRAGGTAVFRSGQLLQLRDGSNQSLITELSGAVFGSRQLVRQLVYAHDPQTNWNRTAINPKPFCAMGAHATQWYIKTGGDPSVRHGWDGGRVDKCCRAAPHSCRWFSSKESCEEAIAKRNLSCLRCGDGDVNIGCPVWPTNTMVQTLNRSESQVQVVVTAATATPTRTYPAVIRNLIGNGSVLTFLIDDLAANDRLGLHEHVLTRLSDDVTPFTLVVVSGGKTVVADGRGRVSMSIARAPAGWQVTLVNNLGVTKQPSLPARTDASAAVEVILRLKPEYGQIDVAEVLTEVPPRPLPVEDGSGDVHVRIGAGDLVVLNVTIR